MTDKEKIRAEVERLMNELIQEKEKGFGSDIDDACILELQNVLTFIDSMQEETVSDDLEKEIDRWSKEQYYNDSEKDVFTVVARHFANWQIHQMMKDAVIMEAHEEYGELWGDIRKCNTEKGKKYKVIIIKEE